MKLDRWEQRLPMIVEELNRIDADVICLQEVVLPRNTAQEIQKKLKKSYHLTTVSRLTNTDEPDPIALAILSKKKPVEVSQLALGSEEKRVAMRVTFKVGYKQIDVINTHLYWKPYNPKHKLIRRRQAKNIISWARSDRPVIICGDLNATPRTKVLKTFYKRGYKSAYAKANGQEPLFTGNNPVSRPDRTIVEMIALVFYNLFKKRKLGAWRDVLDYILVSRGVKVKSAQIFGNKPSEQDKGLYPSDHCGVVSDISAWRSRG